MRKHCLTLVLCLIANAGVLAGEHVVRFSEPAKDLAERSLAHR